MLDLVANPEDRVFTTRLSLNYHVIMANYLPYLGPVVQSIVSLTRSLRRQLNEFMHCYFCWKNVRSFCSKLQKLLNIGTKKSIVFVTGIQKFQTQNRSGQPSVEVPPPPPPPKKKTQKKTVVAKTNDIVIYASRCITTFPELSKVCFHFILKKKTK